MKKEDSRVENSGRNSGIIIAHNEGRITLCAEQAARMPSLIAMLIRTLGDACQLEEMKQGTAIQKEYKPDDKIAYNCVLKYRDILKEFSAYYMICKKCLDAYDDYRIGGKAKILDCVHIWYLEAKGEQLRLDRNSGKSELDIIRENSDAIIDTVKARIHKVIFETGTTDEVYLEELEWGLACFTCFCFMECKILERPE